MIPCGHRSMVKLHACMRILAQKMCVQCIRIMCHAAENCMHDASHQVTRYPAICIPPSTWPPCSCIFNNFAHTAHWLPHKLQASSLHSGQTSWEQSADAVSAMSHLLFLCYSSPQIRLTRSLSIHEL